MTFGWQLYSHFRPRLCEKSIVFVQNGVFFKTRYIFVTLSEIAVEMPKY